MHSSLQPKTNVRLVAIWGGAAVIVGVIATPTPWLLLAAGGALGVGAGIIQLRALREAAGALLAARTALEVRQALSAARAGRLYLYVFWGSMAGLVVLAVGWLGDQAMAGMLAGYAAFAFARESLTLRGTFELQRLSTKSQL